MADGLAALLESEDGDAALDPSDLHVVVGKDGQVSFQSMSAAPRDMTLAERIEALLHDANLAEVLPEYELNSISADLLEGIESDISSREPWDKMSKDIIKLLGLIYEQRDSPFQDACGAYHPLLLQAVLHFYSTSRTEMIPPGGPVRTQIYGDDGVENPGVEQQAERVQTGMNYHLTEVDQGFYPDFAQMLLRDVGMYGNGFRMPYRDPLHGGRPISRAISYNDLIVAYGNTSIDTAGRVTRRMAIQRADMIRMQLVGFYRRTNLGQPYNPDQNDVDRQLDKVDGRRPGYKDGDEPYTVYETRVDLDIEVEGLQHVDDDGEPTGLPLPYLITVDKDSRRVLAIRRHWEEGDGDFRRIEDIIHYGMFPGLGFYCLGLGHILGPQARAATMMLRQQIDAATLASFPAGFVAKQASRQDKNVFQMGPLEYQEIETGGLPINQAIMPLVYRDASPEQAAVMQKLVDEAKMLGMTSELSVGDGMQNAPVGTTLALLDRQTKPESAVLAGMHVSFRKELRRIKKLMGETPGATYPYQINGKRGVALAADFNDMVDVVPVSDPNAPTQTHRLQQAEATLTIAKSAPPGMVDLETAYRQMYKTLGKSEAELADLMPPKDDVQPRDPLGEIDAILNNKSVRAFPGQDHDAHVNCLMLAAKTPQISANPAATQAGMALVYSHLVWKYREATERVLGRPLPPPGAPSDPMMDQVISNAAQQALQQIVAQMAPAQPPMDPAQVAMQLEVLKGQREAANDDREAQLAAMRENRAAASDHQKDLRAAADAARDREEAQAQAELDRLKLEMDIHRDVADRSSAERIAKMNAEASIIRAAILATKDPAPETVGSDDVEMPSD